MGLLLISIIYFGNILFDEFKKRKVGKNNLIIALWLLFGFGGYLANRVTSEAYLPMIFPVLFLLLSLFIFYLYSKRKIIGMTLLVALIVFNLASYHQNINRAITLTERMTITDEILKKVGDHPYLLKGSGMGSQFSSYTMNYEYLLWWKGHPPSNDAEILVTVSDRENKAEYTINRKDELR